MKKIVFACGAFLLLAVSCKKNIIEPVLHSPSGITGFTVNSSNIVLTNANDSVSVAQFKWTAPNYSITTPITYTVLIDQPSDTSGANAWGNAMKYTIATDSLSVSWLGVDFNKLLIQLGLTPGVASPIVVRLKADVNQSNGTASTVPTLNSDLAMTVTPYKIILIYPKLYVAGDFLVPNWTQINQSGWILASVKSNSTYEGYVNFPNSSNLFKLCSELDWNGTNYGYGTSGTTMSPTGGNLYFGGPGYCRVSVDVTALTIQYTPTSWVVAGDFNSWSNTANPMTFNPTTNQWVATGVHLTAGGQFKFVGDSGWNNCYGEDAKGNFVFGNGSIGNITVAATGTYTVTLDLSQAAGNYNFSVK